MKLTKAQLDQLRLLGREPQSTFGSGRVRVQNNLVAKGLARYVDEKGQPIRATLSGYCPESWLADRCVITEAGRARLAEETA